LDVAGRRLDLLVDDGELARRRADLPPRAVPPRGWRRLHAETVLQANLGADLAFLSPDGGAHGGPRGVRE
ncbi:MAG TPA: dihydroxy-acid dehydratase, partial [Trebonia sp.]|nr:dihydroxy-acid dehydratase [Trebonia sp.]